MHMTFDPYDFEEDAWTQTQCKEERATNVLPGKWLHGRAGYCYGKMILTFF